MEKRLTKQQWTGIILVVAGLLLVVASLVWPRPTEAPVADPVPAEAASEEAVSEEVVFEDAVDQVLEEHGFWVPGLSTVAPVTFQEDGSTLYTITQTDSISIMPKGAGPIVRHSYGALSEQELTVAGLPATDTVGTLPADGASVRYVMVNDVERIFLALGSDAFLDGVVEQMRIAE